MQSLQGREEFLQRLRAFLFAIDSDTEGVLQFVENSGIQSIRDRWSLVGLPQFERLAMGQFMGDGRPLQRSERQTHLTGLIDDVNGFVLGRVEQKFPAE